jgi:MoaA/NifB/PqqE/SkfB family radical SAM enzyme
VPDKISEDKEEIEMLATQNSELKKIVNIIKNLSPEERTKLLLENHERTDRDVLSLVEETRAEGMHSKAVEIAKNLLTEGVSVEIIARSSGLSIEEIRNLQD